MGGGMYPDMGGYGPPGTPYSGGGRMPGMPGGRTRGPVQPGAEAGMEPIERKMDPNKDRLAPQQIQELVVTFQSLPAVEELVRAGLVIESLVREKPMESKFGFEETAPWNLEQCVDTAVAWFEQHRAEYPLAPSEPTSAPATGQSGPGAADVSPEGQM